MLDLLEGLFTSDFFYSFHVRNLHFQGCNIPFQPSWSRHS